MITKISQNIDQIEEGMGGNLANFVRDTSLFIAGIIVSLTKGWKLTLVALAMIPIIAIVFTILALIIRAYTTIELNAYAKASSLAAEVLSSVRTVFAFGGEAHASERYDKELITAQKAGVKKGLMLGASKQIPSTYFPSRGCSKTCKNGPLFNLKGIGSIFFTIMSTIAVIFYYCLVLIIDDHYKPGTIVLVVMNLVYGAAAVGKAMPLVEFFVKAAENARPIFATIERVSRL